MGVNLSPASIPTGNNSNTIVIPASTNIVIVPPNPSRLNGYIENKANKSLWVKFGDPNAAPQLQPGRPATEVPPNANIDIPENFTGSIGLIWTGNFANSRDSIAIVTEILP
jgi:hypothetical protein